MRRSLLRVLPDPVAAAQVRPGYLPTPPALFRSALAADLAAIRRAPSLAEKVEAVAPRQADNLLTVQTLRQTGPPAPPENHRRAPLLVAVAVVAAAQRTQPAPPELAERAELARS